jgi:hypothetical protein
MPHEVGHPWSKEWEESQYTSTNNENMSFDWGNIDSKEWLGMGEGVSMMASGFGDLFPGKRIERQKTQRKKAQAGIDDFWKKYKSGEFDIKMDPKMLDYFSMGRRATDLTPTLSAQATSLDMVTDPRAKAAMMSGMSGSASKAMQDVARQDFQQQLAMAGQEGQAYQGISQANKEFMQKLYGDKLAQDQAAYAQAQQNIDKLKDAKAMALPNILAGAGQTFGQIVSAGQANKGMKIPNYQGGGGIPPQDVLAQIMAAQGEGGVPPRQDLPGPESHAENPIDMIAPNGDKVGEATGGEIILNSEQTQEIEGAVAIVDQSIQSGKEPTHDELMAVYEAVSGVLSQPQFQDEAMPAQGGGGSEEERMMMLMNNQMV